MSIQLMSYIWANGPENQSETLVLLALADYANDDGVCWPSVNGLAKKSRLSGRGVQKVLKRLCELGWLEVEYGGGRKNCNVYSIKTPNGVRPNHQEPSKNRH